MMERFDVNGDGQLGLDEMPEMMRERAKSFDEDGDGVLSTDEMDRRLSSSTETPTHWRRPSLEATPLPPGTAAAIHVVATPR